MQNNSEMLHCKFKTAAEKEEPGAFVAQEISYARSLNILKVNSCDGR